MTPALFLYRDADTDDNALALEIVPMNDPARAIITEPLLYPVDDKITLDALAAFVEARIPANHKSRVILMPENAADNLIADKKLAEIVFAEKVIHQSEINGVKATTFLTSANETPILVELCGDGSISGVELHYNLYDKPGSSVVSFLLDFGQQQRPNKTTIKPEHLPATQDYDSLAAFFWNDLNPLFDDPFIEDDRPEYTEATFSSGSIETLDNDTQLLVRAWALAHKVDLSKEKEFGVAYSAWHGFNPHESTLPKALPPALMRAFSFIGTANTFRGTQYRYNDGYYNRQSGFDAEALTLTVSIGERQMTGHERITEQRNLVPQAVAWLNDNAFTEAAIEEILPGHKSLGNPS